MKITRREWLRKSTALILGAGYGNALAQGSCPVPNPLHPERMYPGRLWMRGGQPFVQTWKAHGGDLTKVRGTWVRPRVEAIIRGPYFKPAVPQVTDGRFIAVPWAPMAPHMGSGLDTHEAALPLPFQGHHAMGPFWKEDGSRVRESDLPTLGLFLTHVADTGPGAGTGVLAGIASLPKWSHYHTTLEISAANLDVGLGYRWGSLTCEKYSVRENTTAEARNRLVQMINSGSTFADAQTIGSYQIRLTPKSSSIPMPVIIRGYGGRLDTQYPRYGVRIVNPPVIVGSVPALPYPTGYPNSCVSNVPDRIELDCAYSFMTPFNDTDPCWCPLSTPVPACA